jgi:hypothetical protein
MNLLLLFCFIFSFASGYEELISAITELVKGIVPEEKGHLMTCDDDDRHCSCGAKYFNSCRTEILKRVG